jgi:hypothetical protein
MYRNFLRPPLLTYLQKLKEKIQLNDLHHYKSHYLLHITCFSSSPLFLPAPGFRMSALPATRPPAAAGPRAALLAMKTSLDQIFDRPRSVDPSPTLQHATDSAESVVEIRARMKCCVCGQQVEAGAFLLCLPCCGATAHIACIAKPAAGLAPRTCPACSTNYAAEPFQVSCRLHELTPTLQVV